MQLLIMLVIVLKSEAFPIGTSSNPIEQKTSQIQNLSIFPSLYPRVRGREKAVLETETLLSQKDSLYGQAQKIVAGIFNPKPIVDTISEHEKYGNYGDQFRPISTVIIGGYDKLANFLNSISDFPFETAKQVTRQASASLSEIGKKLTGL